nr:MAG TPA: hypothetical protein [Caudoviricetes sp.]
MAIPGALAPGISLFCTKSVAQLWRLQSPRFGCREPGKTVCTINLTPMLTPILAKKYAKTR